MHPHHLLPQGLLPEQPSTLGLLGAMAAGLNPRGPYGVHPPYVMPVGPFHGTPDTQFGRTIPLEAGKSDTLIMAEGYTAMETSACGLVLGYTWNQGGGDDDKYALPVARVKVGVAGGYIDFECDLLHGGVPLNFPAHSVTVTASHPIVDASIVGGAAPIPLISVYAILAVHGGLGRPGASNPLRRTLYGASLIQNATSIFPVPRLATSFQVGLMGTGAGGGGSAANLAALSIRQSGGITNLIPLFDSQGINGPNVASGQIPIAHGARSIQVTNTGAQALQPVVIFYLSL